MNSTFEEQILNLLDDAVKKYGSAVALCRASGASDSNLSRWRNKKQSPKISDLGPLLDFLGVQVVNTSLKKEKEADRDVCFVNARVVPAGDNVEPPKAEDYIAAPLVGEVGAGPGYVAEENVKSWFLAYKNHPAVRFRRNLLAVEIGPQSVSMQPTLSPGDIVLVDRDDRDVSQPGHMMLVKNPEDEGMIKRVALQERDGDTIITFYSDNAAICPPMVYSFKKDFGEDWERAIVGRVVWAWQDVRNK